MKEHMVLVWLLPILFMVHDFEEIIFLRAWFHRHRSVLSERIPRFAGRILPHMEQTSVPAFVLGVAEEFILISGVTVLSVVFDCDVVWFGVFFALSLHLVIHILQAAVLRSYVPSLATSIALLPYCVYTFCRMLPAALQPPMVISAVLSVVFMALNLYVLHILMARFDRWLEKWGA